MLGAVQGDVTSLLRLASQGDSDAAGRLWSLVYDELRQLARFQFDHEAPGGQLQPTALIHEAYLRLVGCDKVDWANRREFFGAAARVLRQILVDDARKRGRRKRGAGWRAVRLTDPAAVAEPEPPDIVALHEALDRLEKEEPRKAEIVLLRYFGGLSEQETAEALGLSRRTVQMDWRVARAWLHRELAAGNVEA